MKMILVPCPHCGPRNASEFRWCGEVHARPDVARSLPEEWRDYLYFKQNVAGWSTETWYHRAGCERYFRVERNTLTNEFRQLQAADVTGENARQEGIPSGASKIR